MKRFSWVKDCIIQIIFISAAIVFTVMIAHISITEQYTEYYRQQTEIINETLERNTAQLFESRGITDADDMSALLSIIFTEESRYEAFTEFSREMTVYLYEALLRGILIMCAGFIIFTVATNIRKKPEPKEDFENYEEGPFEGLVPSSLPRMVVQILSLMGCMAVALPLFMLQDKFHGILQTVVIIIGGLFLGLAVAHVVRMLLWFVSKRTGTETSYSQQTTQFCIFLLVFLSMFSLSMHNGFRAHIEASRLDELRYNSVFASFAAGDEFYFGEHTESFILAWEDIPPENDLFISAWEAQASLAGIRGDYKYGITVVFDMELQAVSGLSVVREPTAILTSKLRDTTIDFLLAMSATVFAIVFLFIEINKLLEAINIPNMKREPCLRYAAGAKSLNFFITICQTIPTYFFVLIVLNFCEYNPISWLPGEYAVVLPLVIVLILMMAGGDIAARIIRIAPRRLMLLGCVIGAAGFLAMGFAQGLLLWLILLAVAYFGVSIVYNGLQNFISDAADTGYKEFRTLREEAISGEYMGGTSGAVVGAIVYAQFGLFAAFALSAAILLILAVFIRCMLPLYDFIEKKESERGDFGFIRFLFSKRVFMFMGFVMTPFIVGGFFIKQFTPLYADSIGLSPGAASWTFLLMTIAAAFAAPSATRLLIGRFRKDTICILANFLSAAGLVVFSVAPGVATMYIASALLGVSMGAGTGMIEGGFSELEESKRYNGSVFVFKLFGALLGQLGVFIFSFAHALSPEGKYVLAVAGIIAVPTLLYLIVSSRMQKNSI